MHKYDANPIDSSGIRRPMFVLTKGWWRMGPDARKKWIIEVRNKAQILVEECDYYLTNRLP